MLPKIFHEILIDDFIEGGKCFKQDSSVGSEVSDASVTLCQIVEETTRPFDVKELMKYVKIHEQSIKALNHRLNVLYIVVILGYFLF